MGIITPTTRAADSNHSSAREKEGGGCGQGMQWAPTHLGVCSLTPTPEMWSPHSVFIQQLSVRSCSALFLEPSWRDCLNPETQNGVAQ